MIKYLLIFLVFSANATTNIVRVLTTNDVQQIIYSSIGSSTNYARTDGTNTFTGTNVFNNNANSITGKFYGTPTAGNSLLSFLGQYGISYTTLYTTQSVNSASLTFATFSLTNGDTAYISGDFIVGGPTNSMSWNVSGIFACAGGVITGNAATNYTSTITAATTYWAPKYSISGTNLLLQINDTYNTETLNVAWRGNITYIHTLANIPTYTLGINIP